MIGYQGTGKQAASAIRDVSGGKVIVVENDSNLELAAKLNGFEVSNLEDALPISDFIILAKEKKIRLEMMQQAKDKCIFASLEDAPKALNIDVDALQNQPNVICTVDKPELLNFILPDSRKNIKVLSSGKTLNLPCACILPAPIASSILTAQVLMLVDMWKEREKYKESMVKKPPANVVDKVQLYHQETDLQIDYGEASETVIVAEEF